MRDLLHLSFVRVGFSFVATGGHGAEETVFAWVATQELVVLMQNQQSTTTLTCLRALTYVPTSRAAARLSSLSLSLSLSLCLLQDRFK